MSKIKRVKNVDVMSYISISPYVYVYSLIQYRTVCRTFHFVLLLRHMSFGCSGSGPTICTVPMTWRNAACVYLLQREDIYFSFQSKWPCGSQYKYESAKRLFYSWFRRAV